MKDQRRSQIPMQFAVTCWVPTQYSDVLEGGTVVAILRRYQETGFRTTTVADAIAAIEAGGPVGQGHLDVIAAALEDDGQSVNTAGEPAETDAATDYTVEVITGGDDAAAGQAAGPRAERGTAGEATAGDVRAGMRQAAAEYLDTAMEGGGLMDCLDVLAAGFRALDTGTVTTGDGRPAFTEDARPGPGIALFTRSEAGCRAGPGRAAGARFTLDQARARTWLRHAVAAWMEDQYGQEPPAGLGPRPAGELPEIDAGWDPASPGQQDEIIQLVRRAVASGIIGRPSEDSDLDFEYAADDDGGYYYFLVRPHRRLKLATHDREMRHVGAPGATGTEAALAILEEAVTSANSVLDDLDGHAAQDVIVLTRGQLRAWAGLGRYLAAGELDRLARCIPESSVPAAVGTIISEAMGLAPGPAGEDRRQPG